MDRAVRGEDEEQHSMRDCSLNLWDYDSLSQV